MTLKQISKGDFSHYIIEIDIKNSFSNNELKSKVKNLLKILNLNIVKIFEYNFKPHGATIAFILSSSHLVIHTWPEYNYVHIDLFCCKKLMPSDKLEKLLQRDFQSTKTLVRKVKYA